MIKQKKESENSDSLFEIMQSAEEKKQWKRVKTAYGNYGTSSDETVVILYKSQKKREAKGRKLI